MLTKEMLQSRLAELRQAIGTMQANLYAAQGQEIELKFLIGKCEEFERAEASASLRLLSKPKAVEESGA